MFAHILSTIRKTYPFSSDSSDRNNGRPAILDLPAEILQMIEELLPPSSAVSLALTCRRLLKTLGNESLRRINLPSNVSHRTDFLLSLQRERPNWQYCHPCSIYHPSEQHRSRHLGLLCLFDCVQISGCVFFFSNFRIHYHQAQWVMNRHRFGTLRPEDLKRLCYQGLDGIWDREFIHKAITTSIEDGGLAVYMT